MVEKEEWLVSLDLIQMWLERRHCWSLLILDSFKITHPRWQHWIILFHWRVIFLFLHMTETWLKLLKDTADILDTGRQSFWTERFWLS
nr:hypothetical protein Iba_chr03aCG7840 [Ipomoea batatas]